MIHLNMSLKIPSSVNIILLSDLTFRFHWAMITAKTNIDLNKNIFQPQVKAFQMNGLNSVNSSLKINKNAITLLALLFSLSLFLLLWKEFFSLFFFVFLVFFSSLLFFALFLLLFFTFFSSFFKFVCFVYLRI